MEMEGDAMETDWQKIAVFAIGSSLGLGMLIPCLGSLPGHISWYLKMGESRRIARMASVNS